MTECEVCTENQSKYRCPRCSVQTCCLVCVRKHKTDTGCSGQRDKTAYHPVSDFTDIHLLNDYRFLEDCGRKNNNATRDQLKRTSYKPNYLKTLERQARSRNINLRLMPYPMSRRKRNSTYYQVKSKQIFWQLEWNFPVSEYSTIDKRVPETEILQNVLERHLGVDADPLVRHRLKAYITADSDQVAIFLQKDGITGPNISFYQMDKGKSITENLKDKAIVEYPSFHVVLKSHWSEYKLAESSDQTTPTSGEKSTTCEMESGTEKSSTVSDQSSNMKNDIDYEMEPGTEISQSISDQIGKSKTDIDYEIEPETELSCIVSDNNHQTKGTPDCKNKLAVDS